MLDIKVIRTNPEEVIRKLKRRGGEYRISEVLELDEKRRELLASVEELKAKRNKVSEDIAKINNPTGVS